MPKGVVVKSAMSAAKIAEEEIINPLESPEYEHALKWLMERVDNQVLSRQFGWEEGWKDIPIAPKDDSMNAIWEGPVFRKFLEYNDFIPPNENQKSWLIPRDFNKSELKSISDIIESIVNSQAILKSKKIDINICKNCGNFFPHLLQHLGKSKFCPSSYSEQDMADLKAAKNMYSKFQKKEWYNENKEKLLKKMSEHYKQNREVILQKRMQNSIRRKNIEKK